MITAWQDARRTWRQVMRIPRELSERLFNVSTEQELNRWIRDVDKAVGGITWPWLGGIDNNVHTVEVASDPSLALVERPTNSIDALLDLKARELSRTAPSPHAAAREWFAIPPGGLSALSQEDRRALADHIQVIMMESDVLDRPTVVIQDRGTGQHPDDFPDTLLSLLGSTKRSKTHLMGVYNAGGAASYKFSKATVVVSRLAPSLLNGRADEIGVSVVRYDPLESQKIGHYVYVTAKDKRIIRLDISAIPEIGWGTHVRHVEYELARYARGAHEPKSSLWHLLHAALPDPPLPVRIIETRTNRFPGMKGKVERRVVTGLLHLLRQEGKADYSDERDLNLGPDVGKVTLRYFVLNEGVDPDAYTRNDQGLAITLNGQRQIAKDRAWLRRHLDLVFLHRRLIVVVDGTGLTNSVRRQVFAATREAGVDVPLTKQILDRVLQELREDENLLELEELEKQRVKQAATKESTEKVKKRLASRISNMLRGKLPGSKGGAKAPKRRRAGRRRGVKPNVDDSLMLEVPDKLEILNDSVCVRSGATAALRLEINAKNDFLPKYADGLSVIFGPELKDHIKVLSKGRLLGGRVRVTLLAAPEAPQASSSIKVALVVPQLGVLLTAEGKVAVVSPNENDDEDSKAGGEPNIEVHWVCREGWDRFDPAWDSNTAGICTVSREDPSDREAITKVEWYLNEAFGPYERTLEHRDFGEAAMKTFRENYEFPVCFGMFEQVLAEESKERQADDEGRPYNIPDDYAKGERSRLAASVLMAMEPEIQLAEVTAN